MKSKISCSHLNQKTNDVIFWFLPLKSKISTYSVKYPLNREKKRLIKYVCHLKKTFKWFLQHFLQIDQSWTHTSTSDLLESQATFINIFQTIIKIDDWTTSRHIFCIPTYLHSCWIFLARLQMKLFIDRNYFRSESFEKTSTEGPEIVC